MPATSANGLTLEYETFGDPADPPVLLIMGFGQQLIRWSPEFCEAIAADGYRVIRFDNRDTGLSTWFDDAGVPDLGEVVTGVTPPPYTLVDMADDAAGLLEELGHDSAHVVGVSMGGMIAQHLAIGHPHRVRTLTSVMSTTGDPSLPPGDPQVIGALLAPPPATRDEAIEQGVVVWKAIGSPGFPFDEDFAREFSAAAYDRAFHPAGNARHLAAIATQSDRTAGLAGVRVPTLVIHGAADPLVHPEAGRATADAVTGARFLLVPGMGHDLPAELVDEFAAELTEHFARG